MFIALLLAVLLAVLSAVLLAILLSFSVANTAMFRAHQVSAVRVAQSVLLSRHQSLKLSGLLGVGRFGQRAPESAERFALGFVRLQVAFQSRLSESPLDCTKKDTPDPSLFLNDLMSLWQQIRRLWK